MKQNQNNSKQNTYIVIWQNKINHKNALPIRAPLILNCAFFVSVYRWLILRSEATGETGIDSEFESQTVKR